MREGTLKIEKNSAGELPAPLWSLSSVLRPKGSLTGMLLNNRGSCPLIGRAQVRTDVVYLGHIRAVISFCLIQLV